MKRLGILTVVLILAMALAILAACAPAPTPGSTNVPPTQVPPATATTSASPAASGASITVTDDAKRTVTITGAPQHIVSLAPSTTEIAFALGLGKRVIAVDSLSDFPADTKDLPKIKTYPLNLEQVANFKPDLVLAAGLQSPDEIKKLADLKLTVLVVGSANTTFDNVMDDITMVAKVTGTDAQAKSIVDAMKQKVDAVKAKVATAKSKPRVYWELDATDPAKPYTPGPGSFIDDIITLSGGANVAASAKSPYAQINAEEVIAANPEIIILSDAAYGISVESVKARKGWSVIPAIKNDKAFPIDDNLVSRPGPRIVDGLEAAAKLIHPEVFK